MNRRLITVTENNRENEQYTNPQSYDTERYTQPQPQNYTESAETPAQNRENAYPSNQSAEQSGNTSENTVPEAYSYPDSGTDVNTYSGGYTQNRTYSSQDPNNVSGGQYYGADYDPYSQMWEASQASAAAPPAKPKKKGKALKRTAVIVACLALVACVGIGGGFLGSMLADNSGVAETNGEGSTSSGSGDNGESSKSSLVINRTEGTQIAATNTQMIAEKAADSVVEITTETVVNGQFLQQYVSQGAGSGVIISEDGYIITNNHVINGANNITIRLKNGKTYTAKLVGKDSKIDVALLKINEKDLKPVTFGDSDNLKVGETAVAIGNPLGELGGTVTNGIISALDRNITIDGESRNLLQTNAAINPGNSGGGLFNANAELIGLVVAKSSGEDIEGLGFAIPINDVIDVLDDLMEHGYVTGRAYLGVSLKDISSDEIFSYRLDKAGTYIANVVSGGAADKAGLQVGDCITKIDDQDISSTSEASSIISSHKAGDKITVTIYRNGETKKISVTLDEEKPEESSADTGREDFYPYGSYYDY